MQVKFENWTLSLQKGGVLAKNDKKKKKISIAKFEEDGMICLPKELLIMIRKELRHANTFDRFMDKYYEQQDNSGV